MVGVQLTGIFPRSNRLIKATREYDKGLIGREELLKYIREDAREAVEIQRENGIACAIDGMYLWQDIFRPFTEGVEGIKAGALTRWFDNNTFFRKPVIESLEPSSHTPFLHRYIFLDLLEGECKKVILPGLYTFVALSHPGYTRENLLKFAEIVATELRDLEGRGVNVVEFNEPSLVYRKAPEHIFDDLHEAYRIARENYSRKIILHTYFGNAVPVIDKLLELPVDYVGVDFYSTEFTELKDYTFDRGLLCGCVDSRNSYLEKPESIVELVKSIEEHMHPRDVILAPNTDLEFLTKDIARKKVEVLSRAASLLGGE